MSLSKSFLFRPLGENCPLDFSRQQLNLLRMWSYVTIFQMCTAAFNIVLDTLILRGNNNGAMPAGVKVMLM